jgi:hypothetical protein
MLDWETAGFFPHDWELPKWKIEGRTPEKRHMETKARKRQLDFFCADSEDEEKGAEK